jgi:hypothetical protein
MPRFVLLEHDHPSTHLDLLLEAGEILLAWRIDAPPAEGVAIVATRNFDHRLVYLDYEGPISGGRGTVRRIDRGELVWIERGEERLTAEVSGIALDGRLELTRVEGDQWRLSYRRRSGFPA